MAALLLAGALGVHELRYLIAFGGEARETLAHHGHGYLTLVTPLIGLLTALALGHLLVRAAAARPPTLSATGVRVRRLWPAASLALLGIYTSQELLEGLLAPGHPAGWAGVLGAGGWVAVPLALAFGAFVALALRVARLVESRDVARIPFSWLTLPAPAEPAWQPIGVLAPRLRVLAEHLAGRAPPLASV